MRKILAAVTSVALLLSMATGVFAASDAPAIETTEAITVSNELTLSAKGNSITVSRDGQESFSFPALQGSFGIVVAPYLNAPDKFLLQVRASIAGADTHNALSSGETPSKGAFDVLFTEGLTGVTSLQPWFEAYYLASSERGTVEMDGIAPLSNPTKTLPSYPVIGVPSGTKINLAGSAENVIVYAPNDTTLLLNTEKGSRTSSVELIGDISATLDGNTDSLYLRNNTQVDINGKAAKVYASSPENVTGVPAKSIKRFDSNFTGIRLTGANK